MKNLLLCFLILCGSALHSQVYLDNSKTPAQLVQDVLVGEGVTPFNITFNGSAANANVIRNQAAQFLTNFNGNNFGVNEGLILTTGNSRFAVKSAPCDGNTTQCLSVEANGPDTDLASLSQQSIYNSVILEFDFVATGLELNFEFVFASQEYPEYINSVNDSFGFFLSGPGLVGNGSPAYINGARNIALVPGTDIPVAIDNVNNGFGNSGTGPNSQYYYNNSTIGVNPNNTNIPTINYDGFTTVLGAKATLQCGETYHIKLALGNASDGLYDSAVFLKNFRIKPLEFLVDNAPMAPQFIICEGQPFSVETDILEPGLLYVWSFGGSVISTSPTLSVPANSPAGIYSVEVTTANGCSLATNSFELEYYPSPLGDPVDLNLCTLAAAPYSFGDIRQTAALLQGSNPSYHDIRYYYTEAEAQTLFPTPGISAAELSDYYLNGTTIDIFVRLEELIDTGCITVKKFSLNVLPAPSGTFSYPASPFCETLTTGAIQSTVTPGGVYSSDLAGLIVNPSTGEIDVAASDPGSYLVTYHIAATASCPVYDVPNIPVSISAAPPAPTIAAALTFCQGEAATLNPTGVPGATFLWYTSATGGTGSAVAPVDITNTVTSTAVPYYVSQTNGCESPRAKVEVTVNPIPAAPSTLPVTYCEGDIAVPLTTQGGETNLLWYLTDDENDTTDIGSTTAPTPITSDADALDTTTTYYVTQTVNSCESPRAAIDVIVNELPLAPTVSDATIGYCEGDTVPANALSSVVTGTNLKWYTAEFNGTQYPAEPVISTTSASGTAYYVSQTVGTCESLRSLITVNVTPIPATPTFTLDQPTCAVNTGEIHVTAGANLEYSIDNGVTFQSSFDFLNLTAGTTYPVSVRNTLSGCESASTPAIINPAFIIPATPVALNTTQPTCTTPSGTMEINAAGSGFVYSIDGGLTTQAGTLFPLLNPGSAYSIISINTATGCQSLPFNFTINPIPANPAIPVVTLTQPSCTIPTGTIQVPTVSGIVYSLDGINFQPDGTFTLLPANVTYTLTLQDVSTGCISVIPNIVIDPAPTFPALPAITGNDVCAGDTITLNTPSVTGAFYSWTGPDGFTASTQNITIPNAQASMAGDYKLIITTGLDCPSPEATFNVVVNPLPLPTLPQNGYICFDQETGIGETYTLNTSLSSATHSFTWYEYTTGIPVIISGETDSSLDVSIPGLYGISAINNTTLCQSDIVTANVGSSSPPKIVTATASNYFEDNQSIVVSVEPAGNYEYKLDNGGWQSGNVFDNVLSGEHIITVKNECDEKTSSLRTLTFSPFFTPNGDGYNDEWNIFELCGQPNAKIYIFDRYGKLLKEISPCGTGWNGTINLQPLPATDYWFVVHYQENNIEKVYKSHFALKR